MNIDDIKIKVAKLISDAGIKHSNFPIQLEPLAKYLGYEIKIFYPDATSDKVSGAVFKDKSIILVNGKDHHLRQRFTIAHEIGHIELHSDSNGSFIDYRTNEFNGVDREKELQADEFAACLLMPEEQFINKWNDFNHDMTELSAYFGTSIPSIGVRAYRLGLDR